MFIRKLSCLLYPSHNCIFLCLSLLFALFCFIWLSVSLFLFFKTCFPSPSFSLSFLCSLFIFFLLLSLFVLHFLNFSLPLSSSFHSSFVLGLPHLTLYFIFIYFSSYSFSFSIFLFSPLYILHRLFLTVKLLPSFSFFHISFYVSLNVSIFTYLTLSVSLSLLSWCFLFSIIYKNQYFSYYIYNLQNKNYKKNVL